MSLSPHSGFLSKKCIVNIVDDRKIEKLSVLPLPQTVIEVNVTLGGDMTIYCVGLRR